MWAAGGKTGAVIRRGLARTAILLSVVGVAFTIHWTESRFAPVEIQYATTPTSTWKRLAIVPAGEMSFTSAADNNTITRGRFYYFRERSLFDNGAMSPWSSHHGAVWLTGPVPTGAIQVVGKTDNNIVKLP